MSVVTVIISISAKWGTNSTAPGPLGGRPCSALVTLSSTWTRSRSSDSESIGETIEKRAISVVRRQDVRPMRRTQAASLPGKARVRLRRITLPRISQSSSPSTAAFVRAKTSGRRASSQA